MGEQTTSQWLIAIAQNLIAAVVLVLAAKFISRHQDSINKVTGVATTATKKMMPTLLQMLLHIFVFWFFITQIVGLINDPAPINKVDVALISFWVTWAIVYFVKVALERK